MRTAGLRSVFRVIGIATLVGALAPGSIAKAETLRIGMVSTDPCTVDSVSARSFLRVEGVRLAGDRALDLRDVPRTKGWKQRQRDGTMQLAQARPCGWPLEAVVESDWVEVAVQTGPHPAVVEFEDERRWIEPNTKTRIELGARTPDHAWAHPTKAPYRRSLTDAHALQETVNGRHQIRFAGLVDLDPYPGLRAARIRTDAPLAFPDVFLPGTATLRVGLAARRTTDVTVEATLRDARGASLSASVTVEVGKGAPTFVELPFDSVAPGRGSLELKLTPANEAVKTLQVIDPELLGFELLGPARTKRPNVVLLTLDTVRADHMSVYGYPRATTPFLEEVADDLRIFEQAYSQAPTTRPSHFSILTSRYPRDLGIWANSDPPLAQSELSIAEILQSAGWRTAAIPSVRFLTSDGGAGQGFDRVVLPPPSKQSQLGKHTTERAIDFMRENAESPFFIWVHYFDAHLPYQPIPELRNLFWDGPPPTETDIEPELIEKEGFGTLHALPHRAYMTAMYDASIRYVDDQVRALFGFLESNGLLDDTIIVIASDHGESLGEHGVYFAHDGLHEPNVRVPLLVRLPQGARAGRVEAVVENLAIAPTILEAAGLEVPDTFRGTSLLEQDPGDGTAFFEQGELFSGIRSGDLKWVDGRGFAEDERFVDSSLRELRKSPPLALYDIDSDPVEAKNLLDARAKEAAELRERLTAWQTEHVDPSRRAADREVDPEMRERLRALGYTE